RHGSGSAQRDEPDLALNSRFEPHRGARGDVETEAAGDGPVELECRVGISEVEVRADLNRSIADIQDSRYASLVPERQLHRRARCDHLARDHAIGSGVVTRLAPSG